MSAECPCRETSCEPYPPNSAQFDSVAERRLDPTQNGVVTVRCKACGRYYNIETDDTPATHSISNWSTGTEPPMDAPPEEVLRWLEERPPVPTIENCSCLESARRNADPLILPNTSILATRDPLPEPGGQTKESYWVVGCRLCHRWWDVRVPVHPPGVFIRPECRWTELKP